MSDATDKHSSNPGESDTPRVTEALKEALVLGYHRAIRANRAEAEGLYERIQGLLEANKVLADRAFEVVCMEEEDPPPDSFSDIAF